MHVKLYLDITSLVLCYRVTMVTYITTRFAAVIIRPKIPGYIYMILPLGRW